MLKKIRELLGGISQEELARRIGVSVNTINRWENGRHPATFTVEQAKRFNQVLKEINLTWEELPDTLGPLAPT